MAQELPRAQKILFRFETSPEEFFEEVSNFHNFTIRLLERPDELLTLNKLGVKSRDVLDLRNVLGRIRSSKYMEQEQI